MNGTDLTRRAALLAAAGLSAMPRLAGAQPNARTIHLRAEAIARRLGSPDQAESPMFRLAATAGESGAFPVFRGRAGEPFALDIENRLGQPIAFHLRGHRGANAADGVPGLVMSPAAPGERLTIPIEAKQPGTFILSPSIPNHVAEQNARGLHAAIIVEEQHPPPFDHDLVLAVGDWRLGDDGVLSEDFLNRRDCARIGRLGNRLVANGEAAPARLGVRPGARLRVRMVNVANARAISLKVSGFDARVYSIDSTPCQPFDPLKRTVVLAPASRIEMALTAPREAGRAGAIEAKLGDGAPIFAAMTEGDPLPLPPDLAPLPDPGLPPAIRLQDAVRADIVIAGGIGPDQAEAEPGALERRFPDPRQIFSINGAKGGFSGRPVASVKRGRVLVLALINRTPWAKVIAVHGHAFRLLHAFDDGWEPYFLDTLYLSPNATARIALIADNPGRWAIRSTIAEHFATGIATWFEVI